MSGTLRQASKRFLEDQLADIIACPDCDAPRGYYCHDKYNRPRVTCCWARAAYGQPILAADNHCRRLLGIPTASDQFWGAT